MSNAADLLKTLKDIEARFPEPRISGIFLVDYFSDGSLYRIEHKEKTYFAINRGVFRSQILPLLETNQEQPSLVFPETYLRGTVGGIPIFEDDKLLKSIILSKTEDPILDKNAMLDYIIREMGVGNKKSKETK